MDAKEVDSIDGGAQERAMTAQECAERILAGVTCDNDAETGTWPHLFELRRRVTALCVAAGVEKADETTTVWNLVQRTLEIHGQQVPENLASLQPALSQPLVGDVIDVVNATDFGFAGPLDQFINDTLIPGLTEDQGASLLHDEIV
jgi:hypothetical protein